MKLQENRQTFSTKLSILFITLSLFSLQSCAQKSKDKTKQTNKEDYLKIVDYSIRTDIINPDTLKGDQKRIFWHFVKLNYKEVEEMTPIKVKAEFEKIGIETKANDRFADAYIFYKTYYRGHKKACENLAYFEFLKPKSKN